MTVTRTCVLRPTITSIVTPIAVWEESAPMSLLAAFTFLLLFAAGGITRTHAQPANVSTFDELQAKVLEGATILVLANISFDEQIKIAAGASVEIDGASSTAPSRRSRVALAGGGGSRLFRVLSVRRVPRVVDLCMSKSRPLLSEGRRRGVHKPDFFSHLISNGRRGGHTSVKRRLPVVLLAQRGKESTAASHLPLFPSCCSTEHLTTCGCALLRAARSRSRTSRCAPASRRARRAAPSSSRTARASR